MENVQRRLDSVIQSNNGLQRFMSKYDLHAHLLTAAFALSGVLDSNDDESYAAYAPLPHRSGDSRVEMRIP
ncbi:hypothetical protein DFH29DRAFT_993499 [Suillus ampliporus]|nr:hypothetical protein DFH29DRAFT_993499 [Suillus ampliporus]